VSKITKKGPKTPEWFQYFVDNQFNPLVVKVEKLDHLLYKIIKLNNLKTE